MNRKTVAIVAMITDVELLTVPENLNLKLEHDKYRDWYNEEYLPKFNRSQISLGKKGLSNDLPVFYSFSEWLVKFKEASTEGHNVEVFEL